MRTLEKSLMLAIGSSKAALLVAKQLAFDQIGRDGTAVDGDERALAPAAELVHGLGNQFLAGAALTGDEHRDRGAGDTRDLFVHALHRQRPSPQVAEGAGFLPFQLSVASSAINVDGRITRDRMPCSCFGLTGLTR